ncbi:MAG: hypothetical protein HFF17_05530 [Oscillospiraceae bacterium]|nr:hypothetical protein [Oscillospiraceae bacterium]
MSGWGTGYWQDDYTLDIKDFYMDRLYEGKSHAEALEAALAEFEPKPEDADYHLFWGAVALLQWEKGHLTEDVKEKALALLRSDRDRQYWEDGDESGQIPRARVIAKVIKKLERPQCKPKRTLPPRGHRCPFVPGDLVQFRMNDLDWKNFGRPGNDITAFHESRGRTNYLFCFQKLYCLVYIAAIDRVPSYRKGVMDEVAVYGVYEWLGREPPTPEIAERYPLCQMPMHKVEDPREIWFRSADVLDMSRKKSYEIQKIGHTDYAPPQAAMLPKGWVKEMPGWPCIRTFFAEEMYKRGYRGPMDV